MHTTPTPPIRFHLSLSLSLSRSLSQPQHGKVIYGGVLGHCQGRQVATVHGGGAARSTPEPTKPSALDHQASSYSFASRASVMVAASSSTAPGSLARSPYRSRFGDTTLTKVFVGGLAWETPSEGLRQHFEQYGDILEAVVITDRLTGHSKGYGFVTFREPEAARRAVLDPNPTIAGRRANCNIASSGPPRPAQQPRGRASPGPHLRAPPPAPQGPPYVPRAPPPQLMPHHGGPAIYPSQYGYWYPAHYQYQQPQALMNPQVLQNYYAQLYGLASPTAAAPSYHHQYLGYMPTPTPTPTAVLPPAQQAVAQPFVPHPTAQIQGSFVPMPSLPHNFRLQLPPQAMSLQPPNATDLQSADQAASAAGPTNANNTPGD